MRLRYLLVFLFYLSFFRTQADEPESDGFMDTIRLDEITIKGSYFERFSAGSQIQSFDSSRMSNFYALNLNDLIRAEAPVHFKSYGNGMLSSISFRGTGAGHTAVLWNGMNVNQPTVGQTDFSLFPIAAFDRAKLHFGAASARYGSEAIGGAVLLDSEPDWNLDRVKGNFSGYGGSYGRLMVMGKASFKPIDNFLSTTKIYRDRNRNNFKFTNITKPGNPAERQENASIIQYGITQDLYYNLSESSQVSLNAWFNYADREIQPTMSNIDADDSQMDKNFRIAANYHTNTPYGFIEAKAGFLWDYLLYNQRSDISTGQWIGQMGYENDFNHWKVRFGIEYKHIEAVSGNYEGSRGEDRTGIYGGLAFSGFEHTEITFNLNQLFVSGFEPPPAPSLGIQYEMPLSGKSTLLLDGQLSMNYRVPTLNDRYWQPGGRMDLRPEKSRNAEGTVTYSMNAFIKANFSVTGFYYHVDDWILWMPAGSYWSPDNVRNVNASGLELKSTATMRLGRADIEFQGFYSLTHSLIANSGDENEKSSGNQLPYTPVHLAGMGVDYSCKLWSGGIYANTTGKTYVTTDNESSLPGYMLISLHVARKFLIGGQLLAIDGRIDNLFDSDYQNMLYRAMPGRTFLAGLQLYFTE